VVGTETAVRDGLLQQGLVTESVSQADLQFGKGGGGAHRMDRISRRNRCV